jgi:hypothetical protein
MPPLSLLCGGEFLTDGHRARFARTETPRFEENNRKIERASRAEKRLADARRGETRRSRAGWRNTSHRLGVKKTNKREYETPEARNRNPLSADQPFSGNGTSRDGIEHKRTEELKDFFL